MALEENLVKARLEALIEDRVRTQIAELCTPTNPLTVIMKTAMDLHTTPQCKVRAIIEGCNSWYRLSSDELFRVITEDLIVYANLAYNNRIERNYFRELVLEKWLDYSEAEFPYLIMRCEDRIKTIVSELNDLVDKNLKYKAALELESKIPDLFSDEADQTEARNILEKLARKYLNSKNKDIYGVRFIVEYCDRVRDESNPEKLKEATLKLGLNFTKFAKLNGIRIDSCKDFITSPKDNGYSSYHIVIQGPSTPLELQFRSKTMHLKNEDPANPQSHVHYKDKPFNNFLNSIVDDYYGVVTRNQDNFWENVEREDNLRHRLGITTCLPLFSIDRIHRTPNGEIPQSVEELQKFEEIEELVKLYLETRKA